MHKQEEVGGEVREWGEYGFVDRRKESSLVQVSITDTVCGCKKGLYSDRFVLRRV